MGKTVVVGRLTTQGWAVTPEDKINAIFKNYQSAAESSSILFRGNVLSLAYAQVICEGDADVMAKKVENDLTKLLSNVFSEGVTLTVNVARSDDNSRFDLEIVGAVTENGKVYNISKYITPTTVED